MTPARSCSGRPPGGSFAPQVLRSDTGPSNRCHCEAAGQCTQRGAKEVAKPCHGAGSSANCTTGPILAPSTKPARTFDTCRCLVVWLRPETGNLSGKRGDLTYPCVGSLCRNNNRSSLQAILDHPSIPSYLVPALGANPAAGSRLQRKQTKVWSTAEPTEPTEPTVKHSTTRRELGSVFGGIPSGCVGCPLSVQDTGERAKHGPRRHR